MKKQKEIEKRGWCKIGDVKMKNKSGIYGKLSIIFLSLATFSVAICIYLKIPEGDPTLGIPILLVFSSFLLLMKIMMEQEKEEENK